MKLNAKTLVLVAMLTATAAEAKPQNLDRTLSVDSGYVGSLSSNRAFWNFGIEVDYAASKFFDWLDSSSLVGGSFVTRAALGAGTYFGWRYPQYSFFVANHEFGHGTRVVAAGGSPFYAWSDGSPSSSSIFKFFIAGLSKYNRGAVTTTPGGIAVVPSNWQTAISGGGVNNSAAYSEALEDEVIQQGGHILQYVGYVRGKTDTANYVDVTLAGASNAATGDMANLKNFYDTRGFGISYNDMKTGSVVSRWASATHWAYVWSALQYLLNGDPTVYAPTVGGIKLPDISHYLNRQGLSYKIRSGLRTASYWFPVSLEYVYKGDNVLEGGVGYTRFFAVGPRRQGSFGVDVFANSKAKLGLSLHTDFDLAAGFVASTGLSFYQSDTLMGERQIAKLLNSGDSGYEAWARVSMLY